MRLIRINNRLINLNYLVDAAMVQNDKGEDVLFLQLAVPQPVLTVNKPPQLVEVKGQTAQRLWDFLNTTGDWLECSYP